MRLLFIPSWFPSPDDPYAGSFIKQLCNDIATEGVEIEVMHFDYSYRSTRLRIEEETVSDNLRVYRFQGFQLPKVSKVFQDQWVRKCFLAFDKNREWGKFDLVHSHDYVASFLGDHFSKELDLPHICTMHHSDFIEDKIPRWRMRLLEQLLPFYKKVIVPSTALKSAIDKVYQVDCEVIPHYIIDPSKTKSTLPDFPRKAIAVTSTEKVKNNKGLISYCKRNSISIDIYGDLEENLLQELNESVSYKGKLKHTHLIDRYSEYDFYLSFSSVETFGLAGLEALSAGIPVLVKNREGAKDYVFSETGFFIDDDDSYATFTKRYGSFDCEVIKAFVQRRFSKKGAIERYKEIYANLI